MRVRPIKFLAIVRCLYWGLHFLRDRFRLSIHFGSMRGCVCVCVCVCTGEATRQSVLNPMLNGPRRAQNSFLVWTYVSYTLSFVPIFCTHTHCCVPASRLIFRMLSHRKLHILLLALFVRHSHAAACGVEDVACGVPKDSFQASLPCRFIRRACSHNEHAQSELG